MIFVMAFCGVSRFRCLLGATVEVSAATAMNGAAAAPDPAKTIAELARELDLQTRMPDPVTQPDIHWSSTHWHIPGAAAEWVLWGAIAAGLAFALYAMRDSLPWPGRRRRAAARQQGAVVLASAASVARMNAAAQDAEELARAGRFAEAMHMLLLRSLAEMRQRLGVTIADSLTSREILRRLRLSEAGRTALDDLIVRVEPVHFGTRPATAADYGACRGAFDALVGAMDGHAGAAA